MRYRHEQRLRSRARHFIAALEKAGISGSLLEDSLREYSLKVSLSSGDNNLGRVAIYYSPKNDSFTLVSQELKDKQLLADLERCFDGPRPPPESQPHGYEAYVDGSYINGATGYGVVILKDGLVIEEISGAVNDSSVAYARQVAGELFAVEEALRWCKKNSIGEVAIFYDYYGVEKWATGRWKANQPLTQSYRQFVRDSGVRIKWRKVSAHSGNRWNDRADELAKKGAGAGSAPSTAGDRMSELIERTEQFIEFLMVRGIEGCFDETYNDQFARLLIIEEDKRVGILDLYNTKNRPFSPYLHAFKDDVTKSRIDALWAEFKQGWSG